MTAAWQIRVRDANREQVCDLDDFASATFVQQFNDVGGWLIKGIPVGSRAATALVPGSGILAFRNGELIMSGPLLFPTINWSADGNTLDASGASDDLALWARLAYPDAPSLNLNADYSDDRSGAAETVMKQYVDVNLGPGANSTRQWGGLTIATDLVRGSAVSYTARLDVIGDVLTQLALAGGGLGFNVEQDEDTTDLVFDIYQPSDRSATARFSPALQNLLSYAYGRKAATTNFAIVGGGGDGTLRTFVTSADNTSIARWAMRLEGFVDQRQTTDLTELAQAGEEELEDHGDQVSLDIEPTDTAAVSYGTSYRLGDQVGVVIDGAVVVDVVRSIQFTLARDGERIRPIVGTPGAVEAGTSEAQALDVLLQRMEGMARRLSRLSTAQ